MPAFTYQAMDPNGQTQSGVLEGDSERAVRQTLRKRSLIPLSVQLVASERRSIWQRELWAARVFSKSDLALWTRQLSELINAGLTLERALSALSAEAENEKARDLVASIRSEVNAGSTFAKALQMHPKEFSSIYLASISSGEQSGELGLILARLARDLEAEHQLQSKVLQALLYPALVSLIAFFIVIFLLTYVVPQVAHVFTNSHKALPMLTVVMLSLSRALQSHGWVLIVMGLGAYFLFKESMKRPALKSSFDAWTLKLPIFGTLIRGYNAARFANTLATLVSAGVPILKALQAAAQTLSNQAMKDDMLDALISVREGASLGLALSQKGRLPGLLPMFARLGEQTGQLAHMLEKASEQLAQEVQRRALQLATILEPLLIVLMAGMDMLIVLSIMLPIIELNQLVK